MHDKPKIGQKVHWLTVDHSYNHEGCIPISTRPVVLLHDGIVMSVQNNGVAKVKTFVNKDAINAFGDRVSGVALLPCKKGDMQSAMIGLLLDELYGSENDVKLKMVEMVVNNNFDI